MAKRKKKKVINKHKLYNKVVNDIRTLLDKAEGDEERYQWAEGLLRVTLQHTVHPANTDRFRFLLLTEWFALYQRFAELIQSESCEDCEYSNLKTFEENLEEYKEELTCIYHPGEPQSCESRDRRTCIHFAPVTVATGKNKHVLQFVDNKK